MATIYLNDEQHRLVSDAVARAEGQSSGEIVTVIADRSDNYGDIALAWAALAAMTALTILALFSGFFLGLFNGLRGDWNGAWTAGGALTLAAAIGILIFMAVWLIQLWEPIKFRLIPGRVKTDRARERAMTIFKVGAERRTHGHTGIIIYLSMQEHRAEIIADKAIAEKVEPEVWGEAMAAMIEEVRQGRLAEGMIAAVDQVGKVLAQHFPRAADDKNELPDRLIEL